VVTFKRLAVIFGVSFLLLLGGLVTLPCFFEVDHYRPRLMALVNRHLNGRLELGRLKLSLWGALNIQVDGLKLFDASGGQVVSVSDARLLLPLSSLIAGAPRVTLEMGSPSIRLTPGISRIFSLKNGETPNIESGDLQPWVLPGVFARARFDLKIRNASLDRKSEDSYFLEGVSVDWTDASLIHESRLGIGFRLDTRIGKNVRLSGPATLNLDLRPMVREGTVEEWAAQAVLDATEVLAEVLSDNSALVTKSPGVAAMLNAQVAIESKPNESRIRIDSLQARVHDFLLDVSGSALVQESANSSLSPVIALKIESPELPLASFSDLARSLESYRLTGKAKLQAQVRGPPGALRYSGKIILHSAGFELPALLVSPDRASVAGSIQFSTGRVDRFDLNFSGPGSSTALLSGGVNNLFQEGSTPVMHLEVQSDQLDADQLRWGLLSSWPVGQASVRVKSLRYAQTSFTDLQLTLDSKSKQELELKQLKVRTRGGTILAKAKADFSAPEPHYSFSAELQRMDLGQALRTPLALFQHPFYGTLSSQFKGSSAQGRLAVRGSFSILNGGFASWNVGQLALNGVNEAILKASEKFPALAEKLLKPVEGWSSGYDQIRSRFEVKSGRFFASELVATAPKGKGLGLKGTLDFGLQTGDLNAKFEIQDADHLLKVRDVSIELDGKRVDSILSEPQSEKPLSFSLHLGCKLSSPCPSYGDLSERFSQNAARWVQSQGPGSSELKKPIQ
jgi:hypothetical protein